MLFSSGGAYTWAEMIDLIAPGGEFALIGERLAGVIFDSAPCHFSIAHAVNAGTGYPKHHVDYVSGIHPQDCGNFFRDVALLRESITVSFANEHRW